MPWPGDTRRLVQQSQWQMWCLSLLGLPITKYQRLGGLKFTFHSLEPGKFKIRALVGLVPGEESFPGLHMTTFLLHLPGAFLLCSHGEFSGVSSYKNTNPVWSGLHPYDLLNLNYFCKGPVSKYIVTLEVRGFNTEMAGGTRNSLCSKSSECICHSRKV